MKKIYLIFLALIFLVATLFSINLFENNKEVLGYCPTMQETAISLSEENNYELIKLDSATRALQALKNNQVDKALIGRKAEKVELNPSAKETILKSGYTLVSNKKGFVDYSELSSLEVYTYLERDFDFSAIKISKDEALEKIKADKTVLINWEDWNDDFELVVVMNGNEKVKEFRGAFLYEN